ncbi:MAG: hypothetical protein KF742_04125 [Cryobacterium sp.]|nr:hypothetical protein [Cryobacterium sp.]MBX3090044.1 hypothetical protein [Cryobacterium sp.]MCO5293410.1 hypothetical protein [Homoserinimonas sp.]
MRIAASALKRGYTVEQIEHAVVHHTDEFRDQGDHALAMLIGPTQSGELLEVGVVFAADGITIDVVAHVMPARPKYLPYKKNPR